jgi:hexosaminidase
MKILFTHRKIRVLKSVSVLISLIVLAGCADSDKNPAQFSENLFVTWEHLENVWGEPATSRSCFTFINKGNSELNSDWVLYFNQATIMPFNGSDSLIGKVEHINGDFYRLVPGSNFVLHPGDSIRIEYGYSGVMIKESDSPTGVYMVFNGQTEKQQIVQLKNYTAKPYSDFSKIFSGMDGLVTNPRNQYIKNQSLSLLYSENVGKIIPTPFEVVYGKSEFKLNAETKVFYQPEIKNEADFLVSAIEKNTGLKLQIAEGKSSGGNSIELKTAKIKVNGIAKEAYQVKVSSKEGIQIAGSDATGIFYGIQSLLSLLPAGSAQNEFDVPEVLINDAPRFGFRGFLLDVSRNFQKKEAVLKLIDLLSFYKINALNFRMTEDEGWRLEIKGLPELTEVGAKRGHTLDDASFLPPSFGSGPFTDAENNHGTGFYTRADFIEILKYAHLRHVQIVPEICFPSHARAAIKAMEKRYRFYMNKGDQKAAEEFRLIDPDDKSVYLSAQCYKDNIVNIANESCYHFYETVVADIAEMYNEAGLKLTLFHTGGDEVANGAWTKSPEIDELFKTNPELKSTRDLHAYFIRKMMERLEKYNLTFAGWEEAVLKRDENGVATINPEFADKKLIPYVWDNTGKNADLGYRIANAGYQVVLCNVTNLYFDLAYNTDPKEPGLYWGGFQDAIDPFLLIPFDVFKSAIYNDFGIFSGEDISIDGMEFLKPENRKNIVGLQAQLWTETVKGQEMMEYYVVPKLFAYAEKAWSKVPKWETESDAGKRIQAIENDWNELANRIGQNEFARLDKLSGGFAYRIALPGAVIENDTLKANISFPGITIRYTTDGNEPDINSPVYNEPVKVNGKVLIRAFAPNGRMGRSWSVN